MTFRPQLWPVYASVLIRPQDYECFTILSQDTVPALQVLNKSGQWIVAKPMKNHFVVNIGDFFSFWYGSHIPPGIRNPSNLSNDRTNGIFKSTIHRATNLTGQERYSVPFFFGVDYDATVSVIESCVSEGNPLKYPGPVKAGEVSPPNLHNLEGDKSLIHGSSMSGSSSPRPMSRLETRFRTRSWRR